MSFVRRFAAALCALALAVLSAAPAEALRCKTSSACPMMAKSGAPCHATGGQPAGMAAGMDCCRPQAIAPTAPTVPALKSLDSTAAELPATAVAAALALQGHPPGPRRDRPAVALFTLHAVWRI